MSAKFTTIKATAAKELTPVSASKYNKFPDELREKLNGLYHHAAIASGLPTLTAPGDESRQHFCLKKGVIYKWPAKAAEYQQIGPVFKKAEQANVALLEELLKEEEFALFKKDKWVELETPFTHLENPELLQLHMLRRGDFGWGLDAEKCLSVAFVFEWGAENTVNSGVMEGDLRMHVYFVQRLRGFGDEGVRDAEEEAALRAREVRPSFKFGLKVRGEKAVEKKNPLLEAEEKAAEEKRWLKEGGEDDEEMADQFEGNLW